MHRCDWGEKRGQNRVLAIDMKREGFDRIVQQAVRSTFCADAYESLEHWRELLESSEARSQWSPERNERGELLKNWSLQLGIRGELSRLYADEWIVRITDITEMVRHLKHLRGLGQSIGGLLPKEQRYPLNCA
jgi:hypothetical protein